MNSNKDLLYKIAIGKIPGLGPINTKTIISYLGGVEAVFTASEKDFLKIPGIAEKGAKQIIKHRTIPDEIHKEIEFIEKYKIQAVFYTDKDYPFFLKQCNDAPLLIYSKGNINFSDRKILSFIGTRKASPYGKEICKTIIKQLAEKYKPIIVSGLAYGIDACAHRAALEFGLDTVAVLGHGLNRLYPAQHRELAQKITQKGALITEFLSDSEFKRQNFLQRNRIIAGMSQATIVVESAAKGGSLTTAEYANSYNREVFAVPGRIGDKYSEGCNRLIKSHRAALIQSAEDIEYLLAWEAEKSQSVQKKLFSVLTQEEKSLLEHFSYGETQSVDQICRNAQMPTFQVSAILLDLEFKGIIRTLPGKMYELTGQAFQD